MAYVFQKPNSKTELYVYGVVVINTINKNSKALKIIKFLARGKTQKWIQENKGYNKSYISEVASKAVGRKILKELTPRSLQKFYTMGPNYDAFLDGVFKSNSMTPTTLSKSIKRRLHATRWILECKTDFDPDVSKKEGWEWDNITKLRHGVTNYDLFLNSYTARITTGKKKTAVTIYLDEKYVETLSTEKQMEYVYSDILKIRKALQKIIKCRLTKPIQIQNAEFATPVRSKQLQNYMTKTKYLKFGNVWIDGSLKDKGGFNFYELESNSVEGINALDMLQFSNYDIPRRVDELEEKTELMNENINKKFETMLNNQERLENILTQPTKRLTKEDQIMFS